MNMLDEVIRILTFYRGDNNFSMNPHVPTDVEHYARAVLDIPDDEYVVAAIRLSFTKFHRGLILGRDGIYWQNGPNIETNVNTLTWRELSARKSAFRPLRRAINLSEGAVIDNTGSINKSSATINLLDLLIDKYDEQGTDTDGFIFEQSDDHMLTRAIPHNKAALKAENTAEAEKMSSKVGLGQFIVNLFKK